MCQGRFYWIFSLGRERAGARDSRSIPAFSGSRCSEEAAITGAEGIGRGESAWGGNLERYDQRGLHLLGRHKGAAFLPMKGHGKDSAEEAAKARKILAERLPRRMKKRTRRARRMAR